MLSIKTSIRNTFNTSVCKIYYEVYLTHFQVMFDLYRNQVVGFYEQNVWKTPVGECHFR